jgi:hypothetical protein
VTNLTRVSMVSFSFLRSMEDRRELMSATLAWCLRKGKD